MYVSVIKCIGSAGGSAAHNVNGVKHPMVCVVGAANFVSESFTNDGQWQLTCHYVSTDYSNVVESVTLQRDDVRPAHLQAVDGEDCICGITTQQVTIWYHSVCDIAIVLHIISQHTHTHHIFYLKVV